MIEVARLRKQYGAKIAVEDLSMVVEPGVVTGFLGPNGAGKSTTMRCILGLDRPTSGSALVDGKDYRRAAAPLHEVGALLEAKAMHGGRSARNHLRCLATTHGIAARRVEDVLGLVGLSDVAGRRVGTFSLGMVQRLGIAAALLGDPATLLLDEPVNGLDPEGIRWVRMLLRGLAAEGRTVLISSHLMSEMAQTADQLVVVGRGRLVAQTSVTDFVRRATTRGVRVRSPRQGELVAACRAAGWDVAVLPDGLAEVDAPADAVGELALRAGLAVYELTPHVASLEDAFMELTGDSVDFRGTSVAVAKETG